MATYKFYLFDTTTTGETYIYLRLAQQKKTYKFYTDLKIKPKDWNPEKWEARKSFRGYSDFNELLKERRESLKEIHLNLLKENNFSIDLLRRLFYEKFEKIQKENEVENFKTLSGFAKYYIDSVKGAKKNNTILHNNQTLNLLNEFETEKRKKITFERVNLDFYNDFIEFLTKGKKYSPNTIGKHIANIKLFMNEATERGFNTKFDYKSKRFKTTSETVESIYLSEEELLKIYEYDFTGNKKYEKTRDLFIIGCFTGLRFSDFSQLKIENIKDGEIKVKTQKTGERVVIPIHWTVKEILKKYSDTLTGLPRTITNQKMNEYLKEIGKEVKINSNILLTTTKGGLRVQTTVPKYNLMTTHTARRSFATNLFLNGFPPISIMKITGHKTEKSFMKYIKISQEENAKLLRLHWSANTKLKVV